MRNTKAFLTTYTEVDKIDCFDRYRYIGDTQLSARYIGLSLVVTGLSQSSTSKTIPKPITQHDYVKAIKHLTALSNTKGNYNMMQAKQQRGCFPSYCSMFRRSKHRWKTVSQSATMTLRGTSRGSVRLS